MAAAFATATDLIRTRDAIICDTIALHKWHLVVDNIIETAPDQLRIKRQLKEAEYEEAVLNSLQIWNSYGKELVDLTKVLRELKLNTLADAVVKLWSANELATHSAIERKKTWQFGLKLKLPAPEFTGRSRELNEIQQFLDNDQQFVLVITGHGGEGKTELVKKYVNSLILTYEQNDGKLPSPVAITWFEGNDSQQLIGSMKRLSHHLGIKAVPPGIETLVTTLEQRIKASGYTQWLVIIDNVEESYEELECMVTILKAVRAKIIVTARKNDIFSSVPCLIELHSLTEEDAVELVQKLLSQPPEAEEAINLLLNSLGKYALAITSAIAFINSERRVGDRDYGIKSYLELLRRLRVTGLEEKLQLSLYERTMVGVVQASLTALKRDAGDLGLDVLCLISLMNPLKVSIKFLERIGLPEWQQIQPGGGYGQASLADHALRSARRLCMVDRTSGQIWMHNLVHKITRHLLQGREDSILPTVYAKFKEIPLHVGAQQAEDMVHLAWIYNRSKPEFRPSGTPEDMSINRSIEKMLSVLREGRYDEYDLEELETQAVASAIPTTKAEPMNEDQHFVKSFTDMFKKMSNRPTREGMQESLIDGLINLFEPPTEGAQQTHCATNRPALLRLLYSGSELTQAETAELNSLRACVANDEVAATAGKKRTFTEMARDAAILINHGTPEEATRMIKCMFRDKELTEEQQLEIVRLMEALVVPFGYQSTMSQENVTQPSIIKDEDTLD